MYLLRLLSDPPSGSATDEIHLESKIQSCLSRNMTENIVTSDGFLTKYKEQDLINGTEDIQTDEFTKEDVYSLLFEGNTEYEEEIPSAQVRLRQNTSSEHKSKQSKERPS